MLHRAKALGYYLIVGVANDNIEYARELSFLQKNEKTRLSDYNHIYEHAFGFTTISLFEHYDEYLTTKYGN